jgi:hypothetical protein
MLATPQACGEDSYCGIHGRGRRDFSISLPMVSPAGLNLLDKACIEKSMFTQTFTRRTHACSAEPEHRPNWGGIAGIPVLSRRPDSNRGRLHYERGTRPIGALDLQAFRYPPFGTAVRTWSSVRARVFHWCSTNLSDGALRLAPLTTEMQDGRLVEVPQLKDPRGASQRTSCPVIAPIRS